MRNRNRVRKMGKGDGEKGGINVCMYDAARW